VKERLALALDVPLDKAVLREVSHYIGVLKIGWPLILELGLDGVRELVRSLNWVEVIADLKLADIYDTMSKIVTKLSFVDSFIAHSFIGVEEALGPLKIDLDQKGKGLYLVLSMSHPGWDDEVYPKLLEVVRKVSPKGVIVGATKPSMVAKARKDLPKARILSPGVGAQGGSPGDAICAGADVEIVGRRIYTAKDPVMESRAVLEALEERVSQCRRGT
jgi:orotidine-5'-phosphate decarboxylase